MPEVLFVANDNVIEVSDVKNAATNEVLTGATVTVTLLDEVGNQVAGEAWPLSLSDQGNGLYRATLLKEISVTANNRYTAQVDIDAGSGLRAQINSDVRAVKRSG